MPDELNASHFSILREDITAMRSEINQRLDKLVTRESFEAEQRRVDGKIADLGNDIVAERTARIESDTEIRTAAAKASEEAKAATVAQQNRKVTLQQGILIALVGVLGSGLVGLGVIIIQNAAHLG